MMNAEQILDAALPLAAERGWETLHLHEVAQALGVGLAELQRHVPHKDALAEVLFDRAERALVAAGDAPGYAELPARERLARALWAWFDTLAPHRRTAAAMLRYKLQPDHLHLQAQGLLRISRNVQWWREAARLPATGPRRELEEIALSALFVATVWRWLRDETPAQARTHAWLERQLARAEWLALRLPR
jgi:AcrR family transcriptional regulator